MAATQLYGPFNPAVKISCRPCQAQPVNQLTGNFTQHVIDLSLPGRGITLEASRTYNSQFAAGQAIAGTRGVLGRGWSLAYEMRLLQHADLSVTIT